MTEGRWAEAESLARSAVASDADDATGWLMLGRILFASGRADQLDEALQCLERSAELDPDQAATWYWMGRASGQAAGRGSIVRRMQLAGMSRDCFTRAVELAPDCFECTYALVQFHLHAPSLAGADPESVSAIVSNYEGRSGGKVLLRAVIAFDQGDWAGTGEGLRSVDSFENESMVTAWSFVATRLGELFLKQEQWAKASKVWLMATGRLPENATAWYGLGQAEEGLGHHGAAATAYRRSLELMPEGRRADAARERLSAISP